MTSSALTASSFDTFFAQATPSAVLYQRNTVNPLNATSSSATNIGQLVSNQTQLDVTGQVTSNNQSDYYTFNFQGNSPLQLDFSNLSASDNLRFQLVDSKGNIVADSNGTAAQQSAYAQLTGFGISAAAGQYAIRVNYAPTAIKVNSQNYSIALYSGNQFSSSYQTNAAAQTSASTPVPVDNTLVYATSDAQLFSRQGYNSIGDKPSTGVNIGWLSANKSSLNVESQLTSADSTDYYSLTLQQGNDLKLAFNNTTNTSNARVQLLDSSGLHVIADSAGSTAQQAAYAELTSSTGVAAKPGTYVVKVSYAPGANKSLTQNYNFQVYSGTSYSNSYETVASAQTYGNAILTGNPNVVGFNTTSAIASYLTGLSNGNAPELFQTLSTLI